eukprot:7335288-Prymnesium_polylepis.1
MVACWRGSAASARPGTPHRTPDETRASRGVSASRTVALESGSGESGLGWVRLSTGCLPDIA